MKGKDCAVYTADLRIKVEATGLLTYPDVSVVCGILDFAEGTDDTVVNPTLLVEVLSPTTEGYDRGKKFENYRQIPTLRGYLLVSQAAAHIDQFFRGSDGIWKFNDASGLEAALSIPCLDCAISLGEVYAKVQFPEAHRLRP